MKILTMTLVRLAALTVGMVAYVKLLVPLWSDPSESVGADIGSGLIAFALLAATGFTWALVDARRVGRGPALVCWAVVSAVFSLGWHVQHAVTNSDASISAREVFVADLGLVPFVLTLILVPAVLGGAVGGALRPGDR